MQQFQKDQHQPAIFERLQLYHIHVQVFTTRFQQHEYGIAQDWFGSLLAFSLVPGDVG
jgi:hypothetical protein